MYVASFPCLPNFFLLFDGYRRAARHSLSLFRIRVLLSTQTEEQKERVRPGNEARWIHIRSYIGSLIVARRY